MEEEKKWIETKKECEVDETGNLVVKRVTLEVEKFQTTNNKELTRKDVIDLILRAVALFAIGIPVLLFYFQQSAERDMQRASLQVDAYSNISILLHELVENRELNRDKGGFENKRLRVLHEYTPKLLLCTNDDSLVYLLEKVNHNLEVYSSYKNFLDLSDSILYFSMDRVTSLWNALTRVNRDLPLDQPSLQILAISQKSLANAIWNYRSTQSPEPRIYDLFDSLIRTHEAFTETLDDFQHLTQELISVETTQLSTPEKTMMQKLMLREKLSPECFTVLEELSRIPKSLIHCRTSLGDYLPDMKDQLQRLDREFIETNGYLSGD